MARAPLWTRDFTIITLGTVVSMLGNAMTGFAMGLLVLDYTKSTFLYALFMVVYNLPQIFMPFLAGPYLDRFSRKKVIYTLDFISGGLYLLIWGLLRAGIFGFGWLLGLCLILGSFDSIYMVAYDSFYPNLISEGNYTKAYSVSSMIYPLAAVMTPVAAWCYDSVGPAPIFLFNAITFWVAAVMETQIKAKETHVASVATQYNAKTYLSDFKNGISYLKGERGLLCITMYFTLSFVTYAAGDTLILPYFKSEPTLGAMTFSYVMAFSILGRMIGSWIHYRHKLKPGHKFYIALFVYVATAFLDGSFLYFPVAVMMAMQFFTGFLGVTSYNIRISSTQSYVPDAMRGRFNGVFQMLTTLGMVVGQLLFGALGEILPIRPLVLGASIVCALLALIIYFGKKYVEPIYSRDA